MAKMEMETQTAAVMARAMSTLSNL